MGDYTTLMARDGHEFQAWLAAPQGAARGAVVVLQEIFGINAHIRAVTDRFAAEGFLAIAPSLFDRVRRDLQLGYSADDVEQGRGTMKQLDQAKVTLDVLSALNVVKHAGRVAAVGYCWGGTQAYLAACDQPVACAVAYYGTGIATSLHKHPKAPVLYHFGERDKSIPPEAVARIRETDPSGHVHVYPADHGFNCDQRASYDAESARLARERTLAFLAQYLTGQ
jgi:carboxymethylenebutenolidase